MEQERKKKQKHQEFLNGNYFDSLSVYKIDDLAFPSFLTKKVQR